MKLAWKIFCEIVAFLAFCALIYRGCNWIVSKKQAISTHTPASISAPVVPTHTQIDSLEYYKTRLQETIDRGDSIIIVQQIKIDSINHSYEVLKHKIDTATGFGAQLVYFRELLAEYNRIRAEGSQ